MNEQVGCDCPSEIAAHAQGVSHPKMAQVRIVVGRDCTPTMTWDRGINVLAIYELSDVERIALHVALGIERVIGGLMK